MNNKVNFDNFTDNYDELLNKETHFFSSNADYFAEYKIKILRNIVKFPVNRILEYGCGIGRNIPHLQKYFPNTEIIGTDISKDSIIYAKNSNPEVEFMVEQDNLNIGRFDLIFIAGVFHHLLIEDREKIIDTVKKRINNVGSICIFEHNPYNLLTRKIVNDCPYDSDAILIKMHEMKYLLKNSNFEIDKFGYCLFIPPKLSYLLFLENILTWLPLGGQYWILASVK